MTGPVIAPGGDRAGAADRSKGGDRAGAADRAKGRRPRQGWRRSRQAAAIGPQGAGGSRGRWRRARQRTRRRVVRARRQRCIRARPDEHGRPRWRRRSRFRRRRRSWWRRFRRGGGGGAAVARRRWWPWRRRWRPAFRHRAEARHRPARPSRQRPRLLPLQLSRQQQGLCRRDGAGSADGDARRGDARQRRLSARLLRQARTEIPHLSRLARRGGQIPTRSRI